jgi:serine/threonine protein kinase
LLAVLKLVNHPNIIKLQGVYESKTNLYFVMEKLTGGELYDRIGETLYYIHYIYEQYES